MSRWFLALALCFLAGPATAQPKPKAASACGQQLLPLTVGNQWTFQPGKPPVEPPEAMLRFIPVQPKQVTITVTAIENGVVSLEEVADATTMKTTITCVGGKFEASPDSMFFGGEPGGYHNVTFDKMERKLIDGTPWVGSWREDLLSTWKRVPSPGIAAELGSGKLEIERRFTLAGGTEQIKVPYTEANPRSASARRLSIEITGRVSIDGVDKPQEMPANWINLIWFAAGVGPVQVQNSYYHLYTLTDAKIVK